MIHSEATWRAVKRLLDAGWKPVEVAKKVPNLQPREIYNKRRQWNREAYYNDPKNARYHTPIYKAWRLAVFKKYNFRCVVCKTKGSRYNPLQADHIIPWSVDVEKRYKVSNGRALCLKHHKQTPTWGWKATRYKNGK